MSNWPPLVIPSFPVIHPWSVLESIGGGLANINQPFQGCSSATYPTGSVAIYVPIQISERLLAKKLFAFNGAAVSGNIDVGVYDGLGRRIVSAGSTAQTGTNVLQEFDITDTWLGPGLHYLGIALDNTTGTLFSSAPTADNLRALGVFQEASAFALPATATFATMAQAYIPVFGLTTRTVLA